MLYNSNDTHWFPMRIRNSSPSRLRTMMERLEQHKDVEATYAPMSFVKVSMTKMDFAPFLVNYIFVRSSFEKLVSIKKDQERFEPLRFVMHPVYDDHLNRHDEVLFINDREMEDYIRVTKEECDKVIFLDNMASA